MSKEKVTTVKYVTINRQQINLYEPRHRTHYLTV